MREEELEVASVGLVILAKAFEPEYGVKEIAGSGKIVDLCVVEGPVDWTVVLELVEAVGIGACIAKVGATEARTGS